ncbi:MAG: rnhB [Nitrososphaeraceae archaeon]|nr:rnhB [Nitrososphaeraceae archaeon]
MSFNRNIPTDNKAVSLSRTLSDRDVLIGGVDEAGRGSLLGPLVVAGVSIRSKNLTKLRRASIQDSKMLSVKARQRFFGQIVELAEHICIFKLETRRSIRSAHSMQKLAVDTRVTQKQ